MVCCNTLIVPSLWQTGRKNTHRSTNGIGNAYSNKLFPNWQIFFSLQFCLPNPLRDSQWHRARAHLSKADVKHDWVWLPNGWVARCMLGSAPALLLLWSQILNRPYKKSFWWHHKLRSPMFICMMITYMYAKAPVIHARVQWIMETSVSWSWTLYRRISTLVQYMFS